MCGFCICNVRVYKLYVLCSSAPFQTQSVIFTTLLHHLGVPGSSPCGSHWDVLALQEPGSLSIPTRLPWAPCLAPEPLSCATLCTVNMTHGTRSDPGREEHRVTSSPSGLLRALHPPARSGALGIDFYPLSSRG